MKHAWKGQVVVIMGASSEIGRTTALELARKGVHLVLATRGEEPLDEVVRQCERHGVRCLVVPTDVTQATSLRALMEEALRTFGRIDGWVNNAGVYLIGRLEETPDEAFRKVMETNFFGTVSGTRAALAQFRHQGRGTLVNVSSLLSLPTAPSISAYVASQLAVRGFSASVRQEFEGTGIHVCTVMLAAIDTPPWQHSSSYMGWRTRPIEPAYDPERVARAIVRVLASPRREIIVSPAGRFSAMLHGLLLRLYETAMGALSQTQHAQRRGMLRTSGDLSRSMIQSAGRSGASPSASRPWLRRLVLAGGLVATAASLYRAGAGQRLGLRRTYILVA